MLYISDIIFIIIYSGTYTIDIEYKNFLKFFATIDSNIVNDLYDTCGICGARIMERKCDLIILALVGTMIPMITDVEKENKIFD